MFCGNQETCRKIGKLKKSAAMARTFAETVRLAPVFFKWKSTPWQVATTLRDVMRLQQLGIQLCHADFSNTSTMGSKVLLIAQPYKLQAVATK